jgi:hypothetical protein
VGQLSGGGAIEEVPRGTGMKESIATKRALLGFQTWLNVIDMENLLN